MGGIDGWEDDGEGIETVEEAFRDIGETIGLLRADIADRIDASTAALDRSLGTATDTLGELVRAEYAGELAKLRDAVEGFGRRQDGLGGTAGKLRDATAAAVWQRERLEALADRLDGIAARPAEAERQRQVRWRFAAGGALSALLAAALALWALGDRMETRAARIVMGTSYVRAAGRMMEAHDPAWRQAMGVLSWVDIGPEEAARHRECRDRAWEAGQPQPCTVTFRPRTR